MTFAAKDFEDGVTYTGATGSTIGPFTLIGGRYLFFGTAADTSAVLSVLMPDGSSYAAVQSETTSAFTTTVDLPPGTYKIVVVSVTAVQGGLVRVPYRRA